MTDTFIGDRKLCEAGIPLQNKIYEEYLGAVSCKRFKYEDQNPNDMLKHIDCIVTNKMGAILTIQEKALDCKFASFDTLTMEYYQCRSTKEGGEFFNLYAQLQFCGYFTTPEMNEFGRWMIIDVAQFIIWMDPYKLKQRDDKNSNANFLYVPYKNLPDHCIIASNVKNNTQLGKGIVVKIKIEPEESLFNDDDNDWLKEQI
jgi:hypothetical protein